MSDVPYFKPFEEGPLFPDQALELSDDVEEFLAASNRDIENAVAQQDRRDMAEDSFKLWTIQQLEDMGILPPKPE